MEHIGVNNKKKRRYKTMKLNYEVRDLLDVPQGYYLAHCITAQDRFGGAVARQIDSVFNAYDKIHNLYSELEVGKVAVCDNVFNLITKESRYDRVTPDTFEKAVEDMANYCFANLIKKVAMPKIGCGADRLDWETEVLPIIKKAFGSADVEILSVFSQKMKFLSQTLMKMNLPMLNPLMPSSLKKMTFLRKTVMEI